VKRCVCRTWNTPPASVSTVGWAVRERLQQGLGRCHVRIELQNPQSVSACLVECSYFAERKNQIQSNPASARCAVERPLP
jgi:hypothetical protein